MHLRHSQNYFCIVDYNLTRVSDVLMMSAYARERYGLKTILFRHRPNQTDYAIADLVFDVDPLDPNFVDQAVTCLAPFINQIAAVAPFSDNSVISGSLLAERLGLKADSSVLAHRAFSKQVYRDAEASVGQRLEGFFVPRSRRIRTLTELKEFLTECGQVVLKPSCEGNNRGVIRLHRSSNLRGALAEVHKYLEQGLIAEEVIDLPAEYSFDGIGKTTFMTQKICASGRYPVELGQVVPAHLTTESQRSIEKAGQLANQICGQKMGPFHNEIKHDATSGVSAVIEPNRRPAGMRIWHLAERAFGINFFHLWIDTLLGFQTAPEKLQVLRLAGIRMLPSPQDGILTFNTASATETEELLAQIEREFLRRQALRNFDSPHSVRLFNFQWNTKTGDPVYRTAADNSQFMAQICMETEDRSVDLETEMKMFAEVWREQMQEYVVQPDQRESNAQEAYV